MLGSVSSNWNLEFLLSRKRIVDNAILAFKFQQNWLGNISMCFARLVASRCVLEHGVGSGWSESHDAFVKIFRSCLENVNHVSGALFVNRRSA